MTSSGFALKELSSLLWSKKERIELHVGWGAVSECGGPLCERQSWRQSEIQGSAIIARVAWQWCKGILLVNYQDWGALWVQKKYIYYVVSRKLTAIPPPPLEGCERYCMCHWLDVLFLLSLTNHSSIAQNFIASTEIWLEELSDVTWRHLDQLWLDK